MDSIWRDPLETLYEGLAHPKPAPAAVTAAAVTARLGVALLIKTLAIVARRRSFAGDRKLLGNIIEAARKESGTLAQAADDDLLAGPELRRREIPIEAARAAEAALACCDLARPLVTGAIVADLDAAVLLLQAAAQAIRRCADENARNA